MADQGQRSEKPTARRIEKARRDGQFLSARQFISAIQFLCLVAILGACWGKWFTETQETTRWALKRAFERDLTAPALVSLGREMLFRIFLPLGVLGAALLLVTAAAQMGISKMGFSLKKLAPSFRRLSPLAKLRELPRQNIPALVESLLLLPCFGIAVYFVAKDNLQAYLILPMGRVAPGAGVVGLSIQQLLWKAAGLFIVFGAIDLLRQHRRYEKNLRMSKQEIREEAKEMEGNPQVKMRIRRIQREMLRRQMMKEVPTATAVIVNPTHFAVAIRYRLESMAAPTVVAKGKNYLALRIRQTAVANQVPVIENAPLAQALYKSVEVGQEIPAHLYRAVAEILGYIFRLMNGRLPG